jgi:RNA polymerase sigma-70 factor, ECF subfamily
MPRHDADVSEFEQRLREAHRMVYRIAYSVVANAADAEDVTQEAFLRAYQKFSSLRDPEKFRSWVARMSWRLALNRKRGNSRSMGRDGAWFAAQRAQADPEAESANREFEMRLRDAISNLPDKLRSVVMLSGVEELDTRAVAAILGIPEGTVRSRLHLARRQLLKALML